MKKLNNKKGFTLIEMLVVIAIIAILVAIIIPVVSAATDKAACATNAANLRSIKAEATTELLSGVDNSDGYVSYDASSKALTVNISAPVAKAVGNCTATAATIHVDGDVVTVTYDNYTIEDFATAAESGTLADTGSYTAPTP